MSPSISRRFGIRRRIARIFPATSTSRLPRREFIESLEHRTLFAAIASGQTITASIGVANEVDTYTINGVAGSSILATVGETVSGSTLSPRIELHAPNGTLLTSGQSFTGITITSSNLAVTGTYTILVKDASTNTGGYAVTAVSTGAGIVQNAGGDAGAVGSAETRNAAISVGDIDVFSLTGKQAGTFLATIGETTAGSTLSPQINLFSPTGALLTSGQSFTGITITSSNLAANGTYLVVVRDASGSGTGNYAVTSVSLGSGIAQNPGGDAGPATSALTKNATMGIGDIDVFTITGNQAGSLLAAVGETTAGSTLSPQISLYSPTGALLTSGQSFTGINITSANLAATGTYFVVVRDASGAGTGNYAVTPVSLGAGIAQNNGGDAGPTTSALTKNANIGMGDIDVFTISGIKAGTFLAAIGETTAGSTLSPYIALYSPTGGLLTSSQSFTGTNITLNNLLTTATYFVVVRDAGGSGIGNYAVTAASLGLGIKQDAGGDGGFIPSGIQRNATIGNGDLDIHPFYAVTGDKLVMSVAESVAGSTLSPLIALYDPTGKLLTSSQSFTTTSITVNSAAASGIYFLLIRDTGGTGTGGYKLNLTETPSPTKPTITIATTDNLAVENGPDTGTFTITRTNIRALPVTVKYTITGTATNGTDYTTIAGTAVIPANQASVQIKVSPKTDALKENSETVVLTLQSDAAYILGAAKTATVTIDDGATISGTVFNDLDGSGGRNGTEPGLGSWKVFLDTDGDGVLDANERSVLTDSSGAYIFAGLAPATYKVRVVLQTGFNQTLPAANGFQSVPLALGATKAGVLFGVKHV